jgi:glycogen synthase
VRVLQLGPFPPPWGGIQTHIVGLRDYLRRHGVPCAVANITGNHKPDADEVYYPKSAADLLRLLATLDYDVVHAHVGGTLPPRVLALLLICALWPGKKAVFTFHSGGFPSSPEGRSATRRSPLGFVLRRMDAVIGVNGELVSMFRRLGVRPDRARHVLPYAFGPATDALASRGRDALPEPLRAFFASHDPVLLTVGLLEPEYDLPLQIETLGAVRERLPNAGLVIVGSGSLEGELRERIAAQPWREHVLLCGDVPRESTLIAIAECGILLRTTLYDGDAISVREALHLGTPVIASDNGMRPAGVRLIPKQDPRALVDAIVRTVGDTSGRPRARAPHDEANLAEVLRVYEQVTGERVLAPDEAEPELAAR